MPIKYLIIYLTTIILLLISCKDKSKVVLPMEEEKVIALLGDMHFASSASSIHKVEDRDSMKLVYESQVFEINKVTRNEYNALITALESDLDLYFEIEKKVHAYLKNIQNEKT